MTRSSLTALVLCLLPSVVLGQADPVRVTFLDVGQGDAVLVRSPEGRTALIDAGPGVDLLPALHRLGVHELDLVIASHPHADHIGGMGRVLTSMPVRFYMDNGQPYTTSTYSVLMDELRRRPEITYLRATPRTLELGSTTLRVLPLPEDRDSNPNNASVGLIVEHGSFVAFLSGDSEGPELVHFLHAGVVPRVALLKAPHHGSDDAVSGPFLRAARPDIVVVSVGRGNSYGHPKPAALYAYRQYAQLLRTDLQGEITIEGYRDGSYEVVLGEPVAAGDGPPSPEPWR